MVRLKMIFGTIGLAFVASWAAGEGPSDRHIRVDQFGYRTEAKKTAILRRAMAGFDSPDAYTPSATIQIRRAADDSVAFQGAPVAWNGGATHAQSGDRVWWLDFSSLRETGTYYVHDPANGVSSEPFRIEPDAYAQATRQAVRMYYHQRCGTAKSAAYAGAAWSDTTCHLGTGQDLECRSVLNPVPGTARDLSGGWHDAGDYNKYVNYADDALHMLLDAYEIEPNVWSDGLNTTALLRLKIWTRSGRWVS